MRIYINVGLLLMAAFLSYFIYRVLDNEKVFTDQRDFRYALVAERLIRLDEGQKIYFNNEGTYPPTLDSLVKYMVKASIYQVVKRDTIMGTPDNPQTLTKIDTIPKGLIKDVWMKGLRAADVYYLPVGLTDRFYTYKLDTVADNQGKKIIHYEFSAAKESILKDMDKDMLNNELESWDSPVNGKELKIGSKSEIRQGVKGNWNSDIQQRAMEFIKKTNP